MLCLLLPRRASAGFTLLELLVVLVIAAIAASVVGAGVQGYLERARYQETVRDIASQLNHARAASMDTGQTVVVSYQPQSRTLLMGATPLVEMPNSVEVKWQRLDGARQSGPDLSEPIFVFNADGFARGGQITVLRAGRGVMFGVNWLLGSIEQARVEGAS